MQIKYNVEVLVTLNAILMIITLLPGKLLVDLPVSLLHQHGQPQVATIFGPSDHLQILWVAVQLGNQKQTVMMN
jgi:hypothetical protein